MQYNILVSVTTRFRMPQEERVEVNGRVRRKAVFEENSEGEDEDSNDEEDEVTLLVVRTSSLHSIITSLDF